MSLVINHNLSALNTHRNLSVSGNSMSKAIEKLSSGYKINVGADDPSGLIISEQLRSQISGLERAVRNSSEAFNLIGIAEGALNEMNTILKKMRALAIHAANSGITSPEQVAADQAEMDSGIETLNRIANTTRYSDQYLLNGSKQLVYDINTIVDEPTDHALLDTKMSRVDQVFKRSGFSMSIGFTGSASDSQANTNTSAQRAYLEADAAHSLCEITGNSVTAKQEFTLTGTSGSRMFSFAAGTHVGTIVDAINNVKDSTGIGATMTFASDVRIDTTTVGTGYNPMTGEPTAPNYKTNTAAEPITGYDDGTYVYQTGDVQIYGAGLNDPETSKIKSVVVTPDAAAAFKVGYNCDGDGKIYAKVVDKSTGAIEYYKDKDCTMLIGKGDSTYFAATNNSSIPSSPTQNLDGIFIDINTDNAQDLDVFEIAVIGQRLDNMKDMDVTGLAGWCDIENSVMSGVNLGVNTSVEGNIFFRYTPVSWEADGETVATFRVEAFSDASMDSKYLVASSGVVSNNMNFGRAYDPGDPNAIPPVDPTLGQIAGQTVRLEAANDSGLNITLNLPKAGAMEGMSSMTLEELRQTDEYRSLAGAVASAEADFELATETGSNFDNAKLALEAAKAALEAAENALRPYQAIMDSKEAAAVAAEQARTDARTLLDSLVAAYGTGINVAGDLSDIFDAAAPGTLDADMTALLTVASAFNKNDVFAEIAGAITDWVQANAGFPIVEADLNSVVTGIKSLLAADPSSIYVNAPTAQTDYNSLIDGLVADWFTGSSGSMGKINEINTAFTDYIAKDTSALALRADATAYAGDASYVAAQGDVTSAENVLNAPGTGAQALYDLEYQLVKPLQDSMTALQTQLKALEATVGSAASFMPSIEQTGNITFTNLGLRIYALDYGSAETIRIQNKAGNLFYQYREADNLEKTMVEPDTTVQVNGQDAQISLNGAPVFTTGLVVNTTTPDFSGSLVFNAGTLGKTTLAVAGYEDGRLFSKATSLQGIEENEADLQELGRYFEPPAFTFSMGDYDTDTGLLDGNGRPVNMHLDFTQLDPTVQAKIDNLGSAANIEVSYDATTNRITINAQGLGTDPDNLLSVTIPVDPENLKDGYYITDPALKGLYIKTDNLINAKKTAAGGDYQAETQVTTAYQGNLLLEVGTYATNPRGNTTETMSNFLGGMQFQLGNTEGDQDRTVYSIQSMSMSELGRISYEGAEYCLQNVLGGGVASLSKDPILAMRILSQAVDDVSNLRARLGAFQSNMLQTNINSLEVAIENITKTESAIRDADMASESTEFTRFQIMQQAGTSMLAQANQISQNVLSLLR